MRLEILSFSVIALCVSVVSSNEESGEIQYSNSWAVHVNEDNQDSVNDIALKHGFINRGQIGHLPGYYLFEKQEGKNYRGKRSIKNHTEILLAEPKINWVKQQRLLERSKRNIISDESHTLRYKRDMAVSVQDPYYKDQWYLQNIGQSSGPAGQDINVLPVWARGYSGKGVVVSILDDGVDHTHPDLRRNYDSYASFDLNAFDNDPMPRSKDAINCHGTRCAGEIAAEANNGICGVGVSFNASIGGIRMLDGAITDTIEGMSLSYHSDYIDIYTCCWGPKDDGKRLGKPGAFASKALQMGTEKGRGGKGSIFVWATGNGGLTDDDCNCDGYTTSIYTVSIGAISDHGLSTYYTETCASTIAVTYSGASHREADENKIVTTDLNHKCTKTFKGTSSAAPLASGMLALVLEANPNLTWRDIQHIIVETSQKTSPLDEGWKRNGAGKLFNHKFGFGNLDVMRMVEAALKWKTVPEQRVCKDTIHDAPRYIPSSGSLIVSDNTSSCVGSMSQVRKLEHVQVVLTLKHRRRGDLSVMLISPSGTKSQLLKTRRNDNSSQGFKGWVFMTVHFWGEDPKGLWSLIITDNDRNTREHHQTKAKQGDLEDVTRVVMDDTEKSGQWNSHEINEYDKPKLVPSLKNHTTPDHILKNMEDTAGELVKGNKFIELAKRKKNRKNNVVKAKIGDSKHAKKDKKATNQHKFQQRKKKHDVTKQDKHSKPLQTYRYHFFQYQTNKKIYKHKLSIKRSHVNHINKHKRKHKHKAKHLNIPSAAFHKKKQAYVKPLMADGSLKIPNGSPLEAKLALKSLASPIIEKIMGFTKSNFLPMKRRHNTLVGEVDIKMRLFGNGKQENRRENTASTKSSSNKNSKKATRLQKQLKDIYSTQRISTKDLDVNQTQSGNIYSTLLNAINAERRNPTSEMSSQRTNQLTDTGLPPMEYNIAENTNNTGSSSESNFYSNASNQGDNGENRQTGKNATDSNMETSDDKPVFYDTDTKKYVTVRKHGPIDTTNPEAVIIASEGSGRSYSARKVTESEDKYGRNTTMEAGLTGTQADGNVHCGEKSLGIECLFNKEGKTNNQNIDKELLREDDDDKYKVPLNYHDHNKKNKTKGPPDDFGMVNLNILTGKNESDIESLNLEKERGKESLKEPDGHDDDRGREATDYMTSYKGSESDRVSRQTNSTTTENTKPQQEVHMLESNSMNTGSSTKLIENKTREMETNATESASPIERTPSERKKSTGSIITGGGNGNSWNGTMEAGLTGTLEDKNLHCEGHLDRIECLLNKNGSVNNTDIDTALLREDDDDDEYKSQLNYDNDKKRNKTKGPPDDFGLVDVNVFNGNTNLPNGSKYDEVKEVDAYDNNRGREKKLQDVNQHNGPREFSDNGNVVKAKTSGKTRSEQVVPIHNITDNLLTSDKTTGTGSYLTGNPSESKTAVRNNKTGSAIIEDVYNRNGTMMTEPTGTQADGNVDCRGISHKIDCLFNKEGGANNKDIDDGVIMEEDDDDEYKSLLKYDSNRNKTKEPPDDLGLVGFNVVTGKEETESGSKFLESVRKNDEREKIRDVFRKKGSESDSFWKKKLQQIMSTENVRHMHRNETLREYENDVGEIVGEDEEERQKNSESDEHSSGSGEDTTESGSGDKQMAEISRGDIMTKMKDDITNGDDDDTSGQTFQTIKPLLNNSQSTRTTNAMKTKNHNPMQTLNPEYIRDIEGSSSEGSSSDFMDRMNDDITNRGTDDITGETFQSREQLQNKSQSTPTKDLNAKIHNPMQTSNTEYSQDIEGSSSGVEPSTERSNNNQGNNYIAPASGMGSTQGRKEHPSKARSTEHLETPTIIVPASEQARNQSDDSVDDVEYIPLPDVDLSQILERRPSMDRNVPINDQGIDIPREPYTGIDPTDDDHKLSNEDSRNQESPTHSLQKQELKELETKNFLQRFKQDITNQNIPDLQILENELKNAMARSVDNDSRESILKEPIPSLEELPMPRLVRRGLPDHVHVVKKSTLNTNKHEQEHSGILESWNLIFYGTE